MTTRRTVLAAAVGGLAGAALAPTARLHAAGGAVSVEPITGDFAVVTGAGGNVLVRATAAGQWVVDAGAAEHSDALRAALAALPGEGRVRTLFNTHWHLDQVGANAPLRRAGAEIVAHEKTRVHLAYGYYVPFEDRYEPPLPPDAQPTTSFFTTGTADADGERVEYGYLLEAHTDGDIYVYFRDSNVIAVGDAVSPARDPELDWFGGGWLGGRVDALRLLLNLIDERTRVVPSYGPIVGRAAVEAEHALMQTLFERMVELIRSGASTDDMLAEGVLDGIGRTFDDPRKLVDAAHRGLWAHHNTLSPDIV